MVENEVMKVTTLDSKVKYVKMVNGHLVELDESDPIVQSLIKSKPIFNSKIDGRFIYSTTMRLAGGDFNKWRENFDKEYSYQYQFDMLLGSHGDYVGQLRRVDRMHKDHDAEYNIWSKFFTKDTVVALCRDYIKKFNATYRNTREEYIYNARKHKKNRTEPLFVMVWGRKVYCSNIDEINNKFDAYVDTICNTRNYEELYCTLKTFCSYEYFVRLNNYTMSKCPEFIDAFMKQGMFITCRQLIKFHDYLIPKDCYLFNGDPNKGKSNNYEESMDFLYLALVDYNWPGYKFYKLFKEMMSKGKSIVV